MRRRIVLLESANPLQELLSSPLLEQAHKRAAQRFPGIRWYFGYGSSWSVALLHIAPRNLPKLQVSCDVSRNENVGQVAIRHEQLRHQVDIPVVGPAVLLPWLLALRIVAVFFEELFRVSIRVLPYHGRRNRIVVTT